MILTTVVSDVGPGETARRSCVFLLQVISIYNSFKIKKLTNTHLKTPATTEASLDQNDPDYGRAYVGVGPLGQVYPKRVELKLSPEGRGVSLLIVLRSV